jgi:hypothetical protein
MNNTRIAWIVWCCICALGWLFVGLFLWPLLILVPASVLCILLPIGTEPNPPFHYRPPVPSSRFDPRFTQQERDNYFQGPR